MLPGLQEGVPSGSDAATVLSGLNVTMAALYDMVRLPSGTG